MKSAAFDYASPGTIEEALVLITSPDAMVLAGGQSLVPMLGDRSAAPAIVVDIGRIGELRRIEATPQGLVFGAMVRLAEVADAGPPLLAEAVASVGSPAIRNRGTLVGNLVRASPNSELPVAAVALDARLRLQRRDAVRELPAEAFFLAANRTAVTPGEMVTAVIFPSGPATGCGQAFVEIAIRAGAPPLVCVAAHLEADPGGRLTRVRIVVGGITGVPARCAAAEAALAGQLATEVLSRLATTTETIEASPGLPEAAYALDVLPVLLRRAVTVALGRLGRVTEGSS